MIRNGFTLIELLVVFAVTGILSAIGIAAFVNYSRQQQVTQTVNDLKNNLRIAQNKALTQEVPKSCSDAKLSLVGYEMQFTSTDYTIRPKCGTSEQQPVAKVTLPPQVQIVNPPPAPILFKVLTGAVEGAGTIALCGFDRNLGIKITEVGGIESVSATSTSCPTPTPTPGPTPTSTPPTPTPSLTPTLTPTTYTISSGYSGTQGPTWYYYYKEGTNNPATAVYEPGMWIWYDVPPGSPYWNAPGNDWMMLSPGYSAGGSETALLYWKAPRQGLASMTVTDQAVSPGKSDNGWIFGAGYVLSVGSWPASFLNTVTNSGTTSDQKSFTINQQMSGNGDALLYFKNSNGGVYGDEARYTVTVTFTPN